MSLPIRDQIIQAIVQAVDGRYDISSAIDDADLPVCIVADEPEEATPDAFNHTYMVMPVAVARAVKSKEFDVTKMRQEASRLLASIIVDMHADDTFGGLADGVDYTAGGILVEPGMRCMAEAQFDVRYHTVRGDPFTIDED